MSLIYNNTDICEGCSNNPKYNPLASGICHCALPYMTPQVPVHPYSPNPWEDNTKTTSKVPITYTGTTTTTLSLK